MARILIIDDEDLVLYTLRSILEQRGHDVATAGDGRTGLDLFAAGLFDLVITDIVMPVMPGLETIVQLRRRAPDVRIIAISGQRPAGNLDLLDAARAFGAARALGKPVSRTALVAAVDACLTS